jgi:hypothetical protein
MSTIDAEYTITIKIPDLVLNPNESRIDVERRIKDLSHARIARWVAGTLFDPEGKVITEAFKITPKQ